MVSVFSLSVFSVFSLVKVKSVEFIIESFNCQLSIVNSLGGFFLARVLAYLIKVKISALKNNKLIKMKNQQIVG